MISAISLLERIIARLEKPRFGFSMLGFVVVVLGVLRAWIERLVFDIGLPDYATWAHLVAFFLCVFFSSCLILSIATETKPLNVANAMVGVWWLTLLPPIVDRFVFGRTLPYGYEPADRFVVNVGTFFLNASGVGKAILFEIAVFLLAAALYVFVKTKSPARSFIGAVSLYMVAAVTGTPGLLASSLDPGIGREVLQEDFYLNKAWLLCLSLFGATSLTICFARQLACRLRHCLKALRLLPLISFTAILTIAYLAGLRNASPHAEFSVSFPYWTPIAAIDLGLLLLAWLIGWQGIVIVNDVYDLDIDLISNPERPLPKKLTTVSRYRDFAILFIAISLLLAAAVSWRTFIMFLLLLVILNLAYSAPPFRLKRTLLGAPLLIGLGSSILALTGYIAGGGKLTERDFLIGIIIGTCFGLGSVTKDLKDVDGDRLSGSLTVFTVLGRKAGKRIATALAFFSAALPIAAYPTWINLLAFMLFALTIALAFDRTEDMRYVFPLYFLEFSYIAFLTIRV